MKVESQNEIEQPVQAEMPVTVQEQKLVDHRQGKPSRRWWIAVLALVLVVAIVISGILPRIHARGALDKETAEMAIPTVSVIRPKRGAPAQEVVLPAAISWLRQWLTGLAPETKTKSTKSKQDVRSRERGAGYEPGLERIDN